MSNQNWKYHLCTLDESFRQDPFKAIRFFCEQDTPFGVRKDLFELFSAAMGSNEFDLDKPVDKASRMWFLRMLLQLIESAYLIDKMRNPTDSSAST